MTNWGFDRVRANIQRTKRELPVRLAKQAENHFVEAFSKGRLDEYKWEEVQRRIPGTQAYKYPKRKGLQRRTSPILVGAGYKKRGGTLRRRVARSISSAQWNNIRLVVDLPYAKVHNEGGTHIPARPYMRQTRKLESMQKTLIITEVDKIWIP